MKLSLIEGFDSGGSGIDVPQGCVALSVPAEDVQAVGGALSAGDVVVFTQPDRKSACIGKQIMVLATNVEHSSGTKAKVSWVTLAVPVEPVSGICNSVAIDG